MWAPKIGGTEIVTLDIAGLDNGGLDHAELEIDGLDIVGRIWRSELRNVRYPQLMLPCPCPNIE